MFLHMDGARIANAAASLGIGLRQATRDLGVDVLSFGGTKNGGMGAEAVIFFDPKPAVDFKFYRKQGMQLASKMRYLSAQFEALLKDNLWLRNAQHANRMAQMLKRELSKIPQLKLSYKVEANGVFVKLPPPRHRQTAKALLLLYVGRSAVHGPLDVLLGHDGVGCEAVCGVRSEKPVKQMG